MEAETGSALDSIAWSGSALMAKFRSFIDSKKAVEGRGSSQWRTGGSKWSTGWPVDQWLLIPITLIKSRIRIRIRVMRNRIRNPGTCLSFWMKAYCLASLTVNVNFAPEQVLGLSPASSYPVKPLFRIRDVHPGSQIQNFSILDPNFFLSRIRSKEFKHCNPKKSF